MKRIEYLKLAVLKGLPRKRSWMLTAFAEFKSNDASENYHLRLISQPWGIGFLDEAGEIVKIDDSKPNTPLFNLAERINIDNTWVANCSQPTETSIGTLLYNYISIVYAFGTKIPYMNGRVSVKATEAIIGPRLKTDPKDPQVVDAGSIYVHEYLKYGQSLEYLKTMLQLCAYSSTPKGILPPDGLTEFKKILNKKYEGTLTDPVQMAAYEKELLAFDAEYMKDDPTFGKFTSGKIAHTARKKLFLTVGAPNQFKEGSKIIPVTESLNEGWPTDPDKYVAIINDNRVASYARGAETVNGGVAAKILLRAANNFVIGVVMDCGTKLGIRRTYNNDTWKLLVGRTVIEGAKQTRIEGDIPQGNYLGKVLVVRSPQYCRLSGDNICRICAGEKLAQYKTGVTIPLTEISAIILAASMAKMHASGLSTARLSLKDISS